VSRFAFLQPEAAYALPRSFDFEDYIETEREMWALFPETDGKRVNFCQLGLTAQIYVESSDAGDLADGETYFLMPCEDGALRPLRMKAVRRLTLDEFRMSHITAQRLAQKLTGARRVMGEIHLQILGPAVLEDSV